MGAPVTAQRDYTVDWRFISLRMINAAVDYDSHFPPGYEAGHTAGLKLLRVAARVRAEYGRDQIGPLYEAIGTQVFDTEPDARRDPGSQAFLEPILAQIGLPSTMGDALEDTSLDAELRRETDEALALTGKDVGTPIIQFQPPDGVAFFGPIISRLPDECRRNPALGPRRRARWLPRLRRAEAQSARATPAAQLRRRSRPGRHRGGLARRQPTHQDVAGATPLLDPRHSVDTYRVAGPSRCEDHISGQAMLSR